jgi:hypothetical protein
MSRISAFVVFVVCAFWSTIAWAQEVVAAPAATRLLDSIVEVLAYALGAAASVMVLRLIHAFEKKTKIDVPAAWEAELQKLIPIATAYVEEQGHKIAKKGGEKLKMGESLELAADFVLDLAETKQVKQMGKEKLGKLIEAYLGETREK